MSLRPARLHLVEVHEKSWCARSLRDALTDTLGFYTSIGRPFMRLEGRLAYALSVSGASRVVDLCSGSGGPWPELARGLGERLGDPLAITLSDLYPNEGRASALSTGMTREADPVDARDVPHHIEGFRTLFSSFHHFRPEEAVEVLRDCADRRVGVGVFEAQARTLGSACFFLLYLPLTLLVVPFVRPWSWRRLFWTYILPLLPIVITLDALVSCLRTYDVQELEELAREAFGERMDVDVGRVRAGRVPLWVTYLIATPRDSFRPHEFESSRGTRLVGPC